MAWIRRYKPKKAYFQNFSWFQFYILKLRMIIIISLVYKTFCENSSHFILKWFQRNSFEEVWFLEESYENTQKIQFWKFWNHPLFDIREYAFKGALGKYNIYFFISNSNENFNLNQYRNFQLILPMHYHFMRYFVNSIIFSVSHRLLYCVFIEVDFEKQKLLEIFIFLQK